MTWSKYAILGVRGGSRKGKASVRISNLLWRELVKQSLRAVRPVLKGMLWKSRKLKSCPQKVVGGGKLKIISHAEAL